MIVSFSTERLRLRPLTDADKALYCCIYTDPVLMRHVADPLSEESAKASFAVACRQNVASSGVHWWVLLEHSSGIGIGLLGTTCQNGVGEIGVMLLPAWHGMGYAAEGIAALVDRLFQQRRVGAMRMQHAVGNVAMFGLTRKLQFRREPTSGVEVRWRLDHARWRATASTCIDFAMIGDAR